MLPIREVTRDKIPEQSQRKQDRNKSEFKQNTILCGIICPKKSSTFIKDIMFKEVEKIVAKSTDISCSLKTVNCISIVIIHFKLTSAQFVNSRFTAYYNFLVSVKECYAYIAII